MDDKWFKHRQKIVGVTAKDIADRMGRDRSVVSRILAGQQKMSLEWASAFADVLQVDVNEVLERAGAIDTPTAQQLKPGFRESDALPFNHNNAIANENSIIKDLGGGKPGIDAWTVKSSAMVLDGILQGDNLIVDTHKSELVRQGDVVLAQQYDHQSGAAKTLLRRYEPPVVVAASINPDERRALVVDGRNVVIVGKIISHWRTY